MGVTKIEWSDAVWNPISGCTKVSPGCDHCYAARLAKRLKAMGNPRYQNDGPDGPGFGVTLHPDKLDEPLHWRKPRRAFVNSMSDLFHSKVPDEFIARVFETMARCPQHTFQILTKRPRRMLAIVNTFMEFAASFGADGPLKNVWLGVSVESQEHDQRIGELLATPAAVRFLSAEPLLGPLRLLDMPNGNDLGEGSPWLDALRGWSHDGHGDGCGVNKLDWVIVGGESGPGARPMDLAWARSIRDQCSAASVPFFMKQVDKKTPIPEDLMIREFPDGRRSNDAVPWGWVAATRHATKGRFLPAAGRQLDGRTWDEIPEGA